MEILVNILSKYLFINIDHGFLYDIGLRGFF